MAQWFELAQVPAGMRAYLEQAVVEEPGDPRSLHGHRRIGGANSGSGEASCAFDKADSLLGRLRKKRREQGGTAATDS